MTQIVLIRPGTTDFDKQRRIQGTLDIPLSEEGAAQARQVGTELATYSIDVVYSSPCQAARETATAVAEALDVKLRECEQLRNLNHGLWQGRAVDEVRQTQPTVYRQWQENPECVCPPGGESVVAAQKRLGTIVTKLRRKHAGGTIAMVVPEPMYSLVRCALAGGEPRDLWTQPTPEKLWEVVQAGERTLAPAG